MGKFGKVVERGDNRKWFKTDPKPNLLTITTGPPPYRTLKMQSFLQSAEEQLLRTLFSCHCTTIPDLATSDSYGWKKQMFSYQSL